MSMPGYTANSEVNRLVGKFDFLQHQINECNALIIDRAIDYITEGDTARALKNLRQLRDNLHMKEEELA